MPQGIGNSKNLSTTSGSDASRIRAPSPDSEVTVKEEKNIRQSTVASEEEIRIATIPGTDRDVGRSQKLYDLEAQYQKPLVAKNQAALENELKEFKRRDEQFKQYVLDNQ